MKGKKRVLAMALAAVFAFSMLPVVAFAASEEVLATPVTVTVYVDGEAVEFPAFDIGGRYYFSLAYVAYVLLDMNAGFNFYAEHRLALDPESEEMLWVHCRLRLFTLSRSRHRSRWNSISRCLWTF